MLVANTVFMANLLRQHPIDTNLREIDADARKVSR